MPRSTDGIIFSAKETMHMAISPEVRNKLQARIDELKKRMQYDANDLDYETHLNQVRELQKIISAASK